MRQGGCLRGPCAGTGGALDIGRSLKNNVFSALDSDHEDESDEGPAKGGKRDKGGKPQPQQQQKVAVAAMMAAKAPVAAVAATAAVAKVARDAPARQAAERELHATGREPRDAARGRGGTGSQVAQPQLEGGCRVRGQRGSAQSDGSRGDS